MHKCKMFTFIYVNSLKEQQIITLIPFYLTTQLLEHHHHVQNNFI